MSEWLTNNKLLMRLTSQTNKVNKMTLQTLRVQQRKRNSVKIKRSETKPKEVYNKMRAPFLPASAAASAPAAAVQTTDAAAAAADGLCQLCDAYDPPP